MNCTRCKSPHIYEPSGLCLECGFRNKPVKDLEAEEKQAKLKQQQAEAEKQRREKQAHEEKLAAIKEKIATGFSLIESGDAGRAAALVSELAEETTAFDDPQLTLSYLKLRAAFFKARGIATKYLEILKKLVPQLPFVPEHYPLFYDLGAALQDRGNQAAARKLFDLFVDNCIVDYEDVKERYDKSCSGITSPGTEGGGHIRVRTGAFDLEAEVIRKWIDAASSENRYFRSSVLLNNDRDDILAIDDVPVTGEVSHENVIDRLNQIQGGTISRFTPQKESIMLFRGDQDAGEQIPCIFFVPRDPSTAMQRGNAGAVRIAARIVGFDRITIVFYILFQPFGLEDVPDMAPRDFNEQVRNAVQSLHPVENDHELITLLDALKRGMAEAVRAELVARGSGPEYF